MLGRDDPQKVASRSLTIAGDTGNKWLVTKGLASGDRLIIQGIDKTSAGDTVKTVSMDANGNPINALKTRDSVPSGLKGADS